MHSPQLNPHMEVAHMSKHADWGSGYKAVEKVSNLFKNKIKRLEEYMACKNIRCKNVVENHFMVKLNKY